MRLGRRGENDIRAGAQRLHGEFAVTRRRVCAIQRGDLLAAEWMQAAANDQRRARQRQQRRDSALGVCTHGGDVSVNAAGGANEHSSFGVALRRGGGQLGVVVGVQHHHLALPQGVGGAGGAQIVRRPVGEQAAARISRKRGFEQRRVVNEHAAVVASAPGVREAR